MKPRHAAALALVGWHLMAPPVMAARVADRNGRLRVKTEIPDYTHRGEINENVDEFYS